MYIYLPIAEISVNLFLILGMGGAVGFLSGVFGIGGGFLLTPLLIFSGISTPVAVATVTTQIVASSASGAWSYLKHGALDVKLAVVLTVSGIAGSAAGVQLFNFLSRVGQIDAVLAIAYIGFLTAIGTLMLVESLNAMRRARGGGVVKRRIGRHNWVHGLPLKMRFRRSRIYVSVLPVVAIGASVGFLGSMLGLGGGFLMVPALIYLLRVPTNVVVGTSLAQILFTMAAATIMYSVETQTVDIMLAFALMVGGVVGAQLGARIGQKLKADQLRFLLALLVLAVGVRFAAGFLIVPAELFSIAVETS